MEGCTCTYGAYARPEGGTGWDVAHYDPECPEHGDAVCVELACELCAYDAERGLDYGQYEGYCPHYRESEAVEGYERP